MILPIFLGNITASKGTSLPYVIFSLSPNTQNTQKKPRLLAGLLLCCGKERKHTLRRKAQGVFLFSTAMKALDLSRNR